MFNPGKSSQSKKGKGKTVPKSSKDSGHVANWNRHSTITFIMIMYECWTEGLLSGNNFSNKTWNRICPSMKEQTSHNTWEVKQLREKLSRLKQSYKKHKSNRVSITGWGLFLIPESWTHHHTSANQSRFVKCRITFTWEQ